MDQGKLEKVPIRGALAWCADEALASRLPELSLPRMTEPTRGAMRAALAKDKPLGNGCVADMLALAEARGFSADPRDWLPSPKSHGQHLPLYQP